MGGEDVCFKIASEPWEFEAVHCLNYHTFVEEISQHAPNGGRCLVDRFHDENTYVVCLTGRRLVGMLAGRTTRPFSLDFKLRDLDSYLPPGRRIVEVRLLAVERAFRSGFVFAGLVRTLLTHYRRLGFDLAVISATTRQAKLYRHLGFVPFGPIVGSGDALFQPMYVTIERIDLVTGLNVSAK